MYGHTFSYCLVEHGSDADSKVVFGEDDLVLAHPQLKYTAFTPTSSPADTFYYVKLKGVLVGGELLKISSDTWDVGKDGSGGTIIDSGTTLSYFVEPAYQVIRQAFVDRMSRLYPLIQDFPVLNRATTSLAWSGRRCRSCHWCSPTVPCGTSPRRTTSSGWTRTTSCAWQS
jgi:aspartyl protease family protein